jgi:hypothetical protein
LEVAVAVPPPDAASLGNLGVVVAVLYRLGQFPLVVRQR